MATILLWPVVCLGIAFLVWILVFFFLEKKMRSKVLVVLLGLTSLGATVGTLGGLSREAAVGEIMAASLGLLSGLVVWIFAADMSKGTNAGTIVSVCVLAFSLSLFVAYFEASNRRAAPERYLFWRSHCVEIYSNHNVIENALTFNIASEAFGEICANIFKYDRSLLILNESAPPAPAQP
ncbi:hypothetical protein [Roseibium marinum]|uniref:Uncharacterized protein n=1 Tax=Roseibium marinum TaxID=281252 RepID=A0A2S3UN85_9HYPH|nr:hypothetical protein [Roseibium marinum]POF29144.1 hypothetical protein CLV41_110148 [Roseibium marinum]